MPVLALLSRGAAALGLDLAPFALAAGIALGLIVGGPAAYGLGHWLGGRDATASVTAEAEANLLRQRLAEARLDVSNARATAEAARGDASRNAAAAARAQDRNDAYARELAARGPMGRCGFTDADVERLLGNAWAVPAGGRRPRSPAGR